MSDRLLDQLLHTRRLKQDPAKVVLTTELVALQLDVLELAVQAELRRDGALAMLAFANLLDARFYELT